MSIAGLPIRYPTPAELAEASKTTTTESQTSMDPQSLAALHALIAQLAGGGTKEQRAAYTQRQQEVAAVQGQRADYSKEAAFADSKGAMQAQLAEVLRSLMPGITRASEGAGTSRGSLQALLQQQAAQQAAEKSAQLGLAAAQNYGQISTGLSEVLQKLTAETDPITTALLQALNIAKGAVVSGTKTTQLPVIGGASAGSVSTGASGSRVSGGGSAPSIVESGYGIAPKTEMFYGDAPMSQLDYIKSIKPEIWSAEINDKLMAQDAYGRALPSTGYGAVGPTYNSWSGYTIGE